MQADVYFGEQLQPLRITLQNRIHPPKVTDKRFKKRNIAVRKFNQEASHLNRKINLGIFKKEGRKKLKKNTKTHHVKPRKWELRKYNKEEITSVFLTDSYAK